MCSGPNDILHKPTITYIISYIVLLFSLKTIYHVINNCSYIKEADVSTGKKRPIFAQGNFPIDFAVPLPFLPNGLVVFLRLFLWFLCNRAKEACW